MNMDRESLGKIVRASWVKWARTQPNPKPSSLQPWEELSEEEREADRIIGEDIAALFAKPARRLLETGIYTLSRTKEEVRIKLSVTEQEWAMDEDDPNLDSPIELVPVERNLEDAPIMPAILDIDHASKRETAEGGTFTTNETTEWNELDGFTKRTSAPVVPSIYPEEHPSRLEHVNYYDAHQKESGK